MTTDSSRRGGSSEKTRFRRSGADSDVSPAGGADDGGVEDDPARSAPPSSATGPAADRSEASGGSAGASSAVERNRSARGPSRMLARLRRLIGQDLLRQLPVVVRGAAAGIVLEHAGSLDGGLGELDRLAD